MSKTEERVSARLPLGVVACLLAAASLTACKGDKDEGGDTGTTSPTGDPCAGVEAPEQPLVDAREKPLVTEAANVPSPIDSSVQCAVELSFKDLDNSGTLDPYEDWRLTSAERAADLVSRLSDEEKHGLLAHPVLGEDPSSSTDVDAGLRTLVEGSHVRFGVSTARDADLDDRGEWANALQAIAESSSHGIPFVLSSEAAHMVGNGRVHAKDFSEIPYEIGLGATGDPDVVRTTGQLVSEELGAVGIRMYLDVPADLYTDPRWFQGQFTFGDDPTAVSGHVSAYLDGLMESREDKASTAAVVGHFPGAGAAKGGWDARLEKGRFTTYPGDNIDAHLDVFRDAVDAGAQVVMTGYGIPETGSWTGLGGTLDGDTIEQVGASFNAELVTDGLRGELGFEGVVLAPIGVLEDAGTDPLGAPWGMEGATRAERLAKAVGAGVDQFAGLDDPSLVGDAVTGGLIDAGQVDTATTRILTMMFDLGLFENPYVDPDASLGVPDSNLEDARDALKKAMVLVVNEDKPSDFLNGMGDGTQVGDKGNAGNGSGDVLPAPPGIPYVTPGCSFFIDGDLDFEYVDTVSAGYGTLTNNASEIQQFPTPDDATRIAKSDYVLIRLPAAFEPDPDSGALGLPDQSVDYAVDDPALAPLAFARESIDNFTAGTTHTQIIVGIDAGRLPDLDQILAYQPSAVIVSWMGLQPENADSDKIWLDIAFGIGSFTGELPVGAPVAGETETQSEDVPGDGLSSTFDRGFGITTVGFE